MISTSFEPGQLATTACLLEISARKPGNVHRAADFEDMSFDEMCVAAVAIGPAIQSAGKLGVGAAVLSAIRATRQAVGKNTNLGTVLLLAPLACADPATKNNLATVLDGLTADDARDVYQAIRLARPGGIGTVKSYDVANVAPPDLLTAMSMAADRDLVARQYTNDFRELREDVVPWLGSALSAGYRLPAAIVYVQMQLMHRFPDSLIARKRGREVARESAARAGAVLEAGTPGQPPYEQALANFDSWLRGDGHARNPGTTADMIAAGLFVALRSGMLDPEFSANMVSIEAAHHGIST